MSFIPRPTFHLPSRSPSYFLGHMARSLRDLPALLKDIDLVIEARDARIPLSGVNSGFEGVIKRAWGGPAGASVEMGMAGAMPLSRRSAGGSGGRGGGTSGLGRVRERVVVYTKRDLAEEKYEEPIRRAFFEHANQKVFFANTHVDSDVKHVLRYAVQLAKQHAAVMNEMKILVVGMPNVGKSSLLNALRRVGVHKGKAFRTSSQPGFTRKLTGTVRIHSEPDIYVYDTPGVMVPYMGKGEKGVERGLKFALTTGIKAGLVEEEIVADYLLYLLNLHYFPPTASARAIPASNSAPSPLNTALHGHGRESYLTALGLQESPTNSLPDFLDALARRLGALKKGGEADTEAAIVFFLRLFREGKLGRLTLDNMTGSDALGGTRGELMAELLRRDQVQEEDQRGVIDEWEEPGSAAGQAAVPDARLASAASSPDLISHTDTPSDSITDSIIHSSPSTASASAPESAFAVSASTPSPNEESIPERTRTTVIPSDSTETPHAAKPGPKQPSSEPLTSSSARAHLDDLLQPESASTGDVPSQSEVASPAGADGASPATTDPTLYAQVSATVRTFLADQTRRLTQTEDMSQTQQRKREMQQKKKERADKWAKKNPAAAAGLGYGKGQGGRPGARR